MKHTLITPLLCFLLLCGCAAQNPPPGSVQPDTAPTTSASEAAPEQDSFRMTLLAEDNTIRRYGFSKDVTGFLPLEENLLFFSGIGPTELTLLHPDTQQVIATHAPGFTLTAENATVQPLDIGISYFNGAAGETVVLDDMLREIRRIPAPDDLSGMPLLSQDGSTLYYCTSSSIRAMDLNSCISRILKESAYPVQGLSGLLLDDTVLQISITDTDGQWRTLFLSSENGQLLQESEGNILPETGTAHYMLQTDTSIFYGQASGSPMLFHPRQDEADLFFLPGSFQAVTAAYSEGNTLLDLYDLISGNRRSELILPGLLCPKNLIEDCSGNIWFLAQQETMALYCWNPASSSITDSRCYSTAYYTREEPDYDGLAACSVLAEELGNQYGLDILIYKDAAAKEPWDYHLEYEYQADQLHRALKKLDSCLGNFPDGFLKTMADRFTALKICIVRSITGSPESGNTNEVNGIQFMDGFDAYIVLSAGHDTEYALYHELSHLMETVVLTESTAYDRWNNLNPEGFRYDNDYAANRNREDNQWLQPGTAYFIDTYAMSYPKEDRARLFEYAMTDGHEELFRSVNLQRKLEQMCLAIRESFDLESTTDVFLWEQYLESSF